MRSVGQKGETSSKKKKKEQGGVAVKGVKDSREWICARKERRDSLLEGSIHFADVFLVHRDQVGVGHLRRRRGQVGA